ncbi:hypothetical protein [Nesterenkonia flava]|uniref:Uncharacterized protein n=1 Tax=Nesterenkonia flava TaxID=469799 RepID=A0ABU1FW78_9MICC|nr:hypothetical protein [Nesterenkonia flava]MDR5712940.1 hypothetical protein [Nesterenkonia flava]
MLVTPSSENLHALLVLDLRLVNWKDDHLSLNQRDHPHERARKTKLWRTLGFKAARQASVRPLEGARIEVWYRYPDNRRREVSNLQNLSKALVDGIVDAGVLPDDSDLHVIGPDNRRDPVNGSHQVVVRILAL